MKIYTVQTPSDQKDRRPAQHCPAFTLTELIVVIAIISLFFSLAAINFLGALRKNSFKIQARQLVSTIQMAAHAAAESDRRYEIIIDLTEQSYLLRQITSSDLSDVLEEEIIAQEDLSETCYIDYVEFDDTDYTDQGQARFRAGHAGWMYGGKIVLLDEDDQPYSIVVNRISRIIRFEKGDVELLEPKREVDL